MLDSVLNQKRRTELDWLYVQKRLSYIFDKFLRYWLLFIIFVTPLIVFSIGFGPAIFRELVFVFLVGWGWLIWLVKSILIQRSVRWQRTMFNWGAVTAFLTVLLAAFLTGNWGLAGEVGEMGPLSWLALLAMIILMSQSFAGRRDWLHSAFWAWLLSSTLVVVFTLVWWLVRGQLLFSVTGSLPSAAVWLVINCLLLVGLSQIFRKQARVVLLAVLGLHLLVLFFYDYAPGWYLLIAGLIAWIVTQLILERKISQPNFILPLQIIIISVVFLLVPVQSLSPGLGQAGEGQAGGVIPANIAWQRFVRFQPVDSKIIGAGLGRGEKSFWHLTEFVDMRSVVNFPKFSSGYLSILWQGGILMLLVFLLWLGSNIWLGLAFIRKKILKESAGPLPVSAWLGLIAFNSLLIATAGLWWAGSSLTILFSVGLLIALLAGSAAISQTTPAGGQTNLPIAKVWDLSGSQGRLSAGRFFVLIFILALLAYVILAVRSVRSQVDFLRSINSNNDYTEVNLEKLQKVVNDSAANNVHRLARFSLVAASITQAPDQGQTMADIKSNLDLLNQDFDALSAAGLEPGQDWQLAWQAEKLGALFASLDSGGNSQEYSTLAFTWLSRAEQLYQQSIGSLPRNLILFAQASRFWRQWAQVLAKDTGVPEVYIKKAEDLVGAALAIDGSYEPILLEKIDLLVLAGKRQEAIDTLIPFVTESANLAYQAGRLSFAESQFGQAKEFYKLALTQSPDWLQARYDLIQTYLALGERDSARAEFGLLRRYAPSDNSQVNTLLEGLEEMINK